MFNSPEIEILDTKFRIFDFHSAIDSRNISVKVIRGSTSEFRLDVFQQMKRLFRIFFTSTALSLRNRAPPFRPEETVTFL
jgi:hypothetical protein